MDQHNPGDIRYRTMLRVSPEHPCLAGHFPNDPVVPGVVLLEHLTQALRDWRNQWLTRVHEVKFLAPLRPGETAELMLEQKAERIRFEVSHGGRVVARGVVEGAA